MSPTPPNWTAIFSQCRLEAALLDSDAAVRVVEMQERRKMEQDTRVQEIQNLSGELKRKLAARDDLKKNLNLQVDAYREKRRKRLMELETEVEQINEKLRALLK